MHEITLAVCAYNCEKYIEETLACIKCQTFKNFDLLILNDCSSDKTLDKIAQFADQNQIAYNLIDFHKNQGIGYGRKYVIENVKTKYIIFVDADDKPYPELVGKLYAKIESDNQLIAVGCYLEYIDKNGTLIGGGMFIGEKTIQGFYEKASKNKLIFMASPAIFNREIAIAAGGINIDGYFEGKPRYQDLCEDLELWTRMSDFYKDSKAIIVIPEVLCQYRKMEQTTSTNTMGMMIKMKFIKSNLLKRRKGEPEESFIQFYHSIKPSQMRRIKNEAHAAVLLRDGVFSFKKGKIMDAISKVSHSFLLKPGYLYQKVKNNLIK